MATAPSSANAGQSEYWNSAVGQKWANYQEQLDQLLVEVLDALILRAAPKTGERILDVGCGSGGSTLAFASLVGPAGKSDTKALVQGVDISEPLLNLARKRAVGRSGLHFLMADAQTHDFGEDCHDLVVSRFGVMFFDDPVAAFANLRRSLRPGGRLVFAAWAAVWQNPWMTVSKTAAVERLGPVPADPPGAPGPFAFADADRVLRILSDAGLSDPSVDTPDLDLLVKGTAKDAAALAATIGPVPRIMADHNGNAEDLAAITKAIASAFQPYAADGMVRVPARIHYFSATRS